MCGENIALSESEDDGSTIVIPKPGIPVTCPSCRSTHDYETDEAIRWGFKVLCILVCGVSVAVATQSPVGQASCATRLKTTAATVLSKRGTTMPHWQ